MTDIDPRVADVARARALGRGDIGAGALDEAEVLRRVAQTLATELDLQTLLQKTTDLAREATRAQFGAFFHTARDAKGESLLLHTLSGAPRETFAEFGMPRNAPLFGPTYRGEGPVRIDDLQKDPRYGGNPAHRGMPGGPIRVRSYLAVPVVERSGEVLGGLFFGHPEPGVFSERAERLAMAIAAHAAVAIENVKLYDETRRVIRERARAEAALHESEQRLHLALEAGRMGVWEWDISSDAVQWSPGLAVIHGRDPGVGTLTVAEALRDVHPEDRARLESAIRAALEQGVEYHVEYRILTPRGEQRWLETKASVLRGDDGAPQRMVGVCSDVTARKHTERALRESEQRFTRFMQRLPGLAWIKDSDGRYLFVNEAAERAFRVSRAELYGRSDAEIFPPEVATTFRENDLRAIEDGAGVETVETLEHEDGIHYSLVTKFPIPGKGGAQPLVGGMAIDITDRVRAEQTRALLAAVVESSDDAIISKTLEGVITSWNAGAERIFGYVAAEAVGRHISLLIPPDRAGEEEVILARLRRGERIEHFQTVRQTKDRRLIDVSLTVSPVRDQRGAIVGVSKVARDVTLARQTEAALRASEERYRQLIQSLPAAVYTCDAEGRITLYNKAAAELWGREPVLGKTHWFECWRARRPDGEEIPTEQLPMAVALRSGRSVRSEEIIVDGPDGEPRHLLPHPEPLFGPEGELVGAVNMLIDLTALREAEHALLESEERFRGFANHAPVAIFIKDLAGRYTVANPIACEALGVESAVGRTDAAMLPGELAEQLRRTDREVVSSGEVREVEELVGHGPAMRNYLSVKFPLRGVDGSVEGVCGVALDITARTRAERDLRESQERLALTAAAADLGAWDYDPTTGLGSWDERCCGHFGARPRETFTQEETIAAVHPEDRGEVEGAIRRALEPSGDGEYFAEYRVIGIDDGVERWIRARGRAYFEDGVAVRLVGATLDFTEQKRAERALRESEEKFRTLADNISQLAWMTDETGWIFWYNRRWFDYTGSTLEEMQGWGWRSVHHPDHVERVVDKFRGAVERGEPWEDTFPLRSSEGEYRWFLSRAVPIRDGEGRILRWFGTNTDITEWREAQEALRESEARFRTMADSAPVLIWIADEREHRTWVNRPWLEFTGRAMEEEVGAGWSRSVHPEDLERCRSTYAGAYAARCEFRMEYRLRRRDGAYRWVLDHGVPLLGPEGAFTGYIGSCLDVTEEVTARTALERQHVALERSVRERTEELEESHRRLRLSERMASIGTLSAGLGHDMANILLPIRLHLDAAESLVSGDELVRRELDEIRSSIEYLQNLSSGLRMLVVDPGERTRNEKTELSAWWRQASAVLKTAIPSGILLRSRLPEHECWVVFSPTALTQVVFNLVQNAIDAMRPRGHGNVEIVATAEDGTAFLAVRDDGPGMAPEVRERCTQPFFTTKTRAMSTGLGLALVYGMVHEAGGSLEIESAPGQGTTVTIGLRTIAAPSAKAPGAAHTAQLQIADARLRAIVKAELQDLGFRVVTEPAAGASLKVVDEPPDTTGAGTNGCVTLALREVRDESPTATAASVTKLRRRIREAAALAVRPPSGADTSQTADEQPGGG